MNLFNILLFFSLSYRDKTPTKWSSCSQTVLNDNFEIGLDYCLRNIPEHLFDGPFCGNGFVEEGEECDCGLPEVSQDRITIIGLM